MSLTAFAKSVRNFLVPPTRTTDTPPTAVEILGELKLFAGQFHTAGDIVEMLRLVHHSPQWEIAPDWIIAVVSPYLGAEVEWRLLSSRGTIGYRWCGSDDSR